ncbi:MAG: DUF4121 family protein [Acholeplasmataceae bacterium]
MEAVLARMNESHLREYGRLEEKHIAKIAALVSALERRLTGDPVPRAGDVVILHGHNRDGDLTYNDGHLDPDYWGDRPGRLHACTQPMTPFVALEVEHGTGDARRDDNDLWWSTSGGYWITVPKAQLRHVGMRRKVFWTWRDRPCGNGGIRFEAVVNVWEYIDRERIY